MTDSIRVIDQIAICLATIVVYMFVVYLLIEIVKRLKK